MTSMTSFLYVQHMFVIPSYHGAIAQLSLEYFPDFLSHIHILPDQYQGDG